MEVHPSLWTLILSDWLHFDPEKYDHLVAVGVVFTLLTLLAIVIKSTARQIPGTLQQVNEYAVESIDGLLQESMGDHGRRYLPLIGTLAFFIFFSNFMGMVPGFSTGTANFNTTSACAIIVFLYYNFQGLKEHGFGYLKHFWGPINWMGPLMLPIEIISHLARPFSLAIRLFGNMSGEHAVTAVFYGLIPFLLPVPLMAFGLFAAFLQTFVFVLLSTLYIAGSIAHDH